MKRRPTYATRSGAHRAARNAAKKALGSRFCAFEGPDYEIGPDDGPLGLGHGPYGRTRYYYRLRGPALDASTHHGD